MEIIQSFLRFLRRFGSITDSEFSTLLAPHIKVRRFSKKEIITREGEVEEYFNFIVKGLARKYYKKERDEISIQISKEGQLILCQESFYGRTPSEFNIEAIEPTTVISIRYDDMENVYKLSPNMEHLGRLVITYLMIVKDKWQMQLIKMGPRERFLHFVTRNAELLQRVPQKYLASYLHIKPETFSRFKHLLRPHNKKSTDNGRQSTVGNAEHES